MPSRPLSFDQQALIGLQTSPHRLLTIEKADEEAIIAELLDEATEWPKRTKREVQRYGRVTPTIRTDLISVALGWTLRQLREETAKWGADHYLYGEGARLLRLVGERAGGIDESLVHAHEWPER